MKKEDLISRLSQAGVTYSDRGKEIFAGWGPYSLHAIVSSANECLISMGYSVWQGPEFCTSHSHSFEEAKADLVRRLKRHYPTMGPEFETDLVEGMSL